MLKKYFKQYSIIFLFFTLFISSCTTLDETKVEFKKFPQFFEATQIIKLKSKDRDDTLLASLKRRDNDYYVTFLSPSIQLPLLGISYVHSKYEIKKYVDLKDFPIPPETILKSIMSVYNQDEFEKKTTSSQTFFYDYEDGNFEYELHNIRKEHNPCQTFPKIIQLTSKLKYHFTLQVETTDLSCTTEKK